MNLSIRLLFLFLVIHSLFSCSEKNKTTNHTQLGLNFCLTDTASLKSASSCEPTRTYYFEHFWLDTSRQFFSKCLLSGDKKDTLYFSVTEGLAEKDLTSLIQTSTEQTYETDWVKTDRFRAFKQYGKHSDRFLLRYALIDKQFDGILLADYLQDDSTLVRNFYDTNALLENIALCL